MGNGPLIVPPHPGDDRERMERESREINERSIRETGADVLWWKLIRNPKFRALVEAEDERIRQQAADELAIIRAAELGIWQAIEEEYERRRRAPGRQLAKEQVERLPELIKKMTEEQTKGTTYGTEAEYRAVMKQIQKAQQRGDRIVLLGKRSGKELKALFQKIDPDVDVSSLQDDKNYGGDLMIIGLERRELENWIRHLALWGQNDAAGLITKTVQMKWGETPKAAETLYQITYAGIQLAGMRDEAALPFGHCEISIGILNPAHPWNALDSSNAGRVLLPLLHDAFKSGNHVVEGRSQISVPSCGLYPFVTRIVIRAASWTFRFLIDRDTRSIIMISATQTPNQHASLMASPRPGKLTASTKTGTLIYRKDKVGNGGTWSIQVDGNVGQRRFDLAAQPGGLTPGTKVEFDVSQTGVVTAVRRKTS
jgi:hypothetical protein